MATTLFSLSSAHAMPKLANKTATRRRPTEKPGLWLAAFTFHCLDSERLGNFQILVHARSEEDAKERCRRELVDFRSLLEMFKEPVKVYLEGLLLLVGPFQQPLVINFHKADPSGPTTDLVAEWGRDEVVAFERDGESLKPGDTIEPFMTFPIGRAETRMTTRTRH